MADISGRRDRNKKSPGVHYDMHRCVRAAVICTVSLQNATWVYDGKCDGEEREGGRQTSGIHLYMRVYVYASVCNVFRIISNDGRNWKHRGAAIPGDIDIWKRFRLRLLFEKLTLYVAREKRKIYIKYEKNVFISVSIISDEGVYSNLVKKFSDLPSNFCSKLQVKENIFKIF